MFRRVHSRLALLLVVVTVVVLAGLLAFQRGEQSRISGLLEKRTAEQAAIFERLVALNGRALETFVYDYTYWDEMVDGIARSDTVWADDNIAEALGTYHAAAAWAFRPDHSLFYQALAGGREALADFVLPESLFGPLLEQDRFCHFFFESPAGLMEVRGATVHPSNDPERKTAPQGFLLVGRLWDGAYLSELGRLFGGDVGLVRPGQAAARSDQRAGLIAVTQELADWRGRPLAEVEARTVSLAVLEFQRAAKRQLITLALMAVLCVGVVAVGTFFLVNRPVRQLSLSIRAGNPAAIQGLVRDRGEFGRLARVLEKAFRQQALLQASEEKYRELVEGTSDLVQSVSPDGRLLFVNRAWRDTLGYSEEEVTGMNLADIIAPESLAHCRECFGRVIAGETFKDIEALFVAKDGHRVAVSGSVSCKFENGRPVYKWGIFRDITERKRAEQAAAELTEELKRSNAELEQFAYVASHDLQEPLRMVGSYTQLLARRYKGKLDADADEFIGFAVDGVTRMQRLINDLLTYSRVGSRGRPPAPTDAEEVFNRVLRNLALAMEDAGATVTHDRLPVVMADEVQLGQLLQNLVGNAIKYHGDEPPRVHVRAERSNGAWMFSVKDNGIGIAPQYHERIFQIFQRLHTRREYEGTGIGLAVCRKIVERHHGRIWVESAEGGGADFRFTLPATVTGEEV